MAGLFALPIMITGAVDVVLSISMIVTNQFFFRDCKVKGIGYSLAISYLMGSVYCYYLVSLLLPKAGDDYYHIIAVAIGTISSFYSLYGYLKVNKSDYVCMGYWMSNYYCVMIGWAIFCCLFVIIRALLQIGKPVNGQISNKDRKRN